jgi:hypothetical protein
MSDIIQALAKAKERAGHPSPPFAAPGSSQVPTNRAFILGRARNTRRFWIILACVSLPLTAFVLWMRLAEFGISIPSFTRPATHISSSPSSSASSGSRPAPVVVEPLQDPTLAQTVARLPISAVLRGNPPRIMLGSKVVRVGELAEGELVFAGMVEDQLKFTDARGAVYLRRY